MRLIPKLNLKNYLPRTLFGRSLLIIVTPVFLVQIITAIVFVDRHWSKMSERLANAVAGEIALIANHIESGRADIDDFSGKVTQSLELLIAFEEGRTLPDEETGKESWNSIVAETLAKSLERKVRRSFSITVDIGEKWVEIGVQLENGVLRISSPQRRLFSSSGYIFLLWMVFTTVILFAIAILFMRNQIRPIKRLAIAAERFGKGRDVQTFKPEGAAEIRRAASAFLKMRERIKRQISQRTAMLASISHDLRTPLTRIKLQLAMLGNSPDTEALKEDVREMESMINGYLAFARGEGGENPVTKNIVKIFENPINTLKQKGKTVHIDKPGTEDKSGEKETAAASNNLMLSVRPVAIERAFSNILNNAGKYADSIWISFRPTDHSFQIIIEDNGPGLPASEYEEVFKPFYRGDKTRSASEGTGLGLPIAMDIVHSHGGQIWLEPSNRGGLRVVIELPR